MDNYRKIIHIAFSLYPDHKSSEGIVNFNWSNILKKKSKNIVEISQKRIVDHLMVQESVFNFENTCYAAVKKESYIGYFLYKIATVVFCRITRHRSLYEYLWIKKAASLLEKKYDRGTVVWSRILPTNSLASILSLYKKRQFPFVVNVNDPIIATTKRGDIHHQLTDEENLFLKTKDITQAWTFPSSKLADNIAEKYKLDRDRCFVIPHAFTPFENRYYRKNEKVKVLYTGTFYKSAFTDEFKNTLEKIQNHEISKKLEFTFVLSQYNKESIDWLKSTLPDVRLLFKLDRGEVLELLKESDLMLVIDAETHTDLLKGKLVEAISFGVPIYTPTYKGSVMDKVTKAYGCNSSYQDIEGDSFTQLMDILEKLEDREWLNNFYLKREKVIDKFSEEPILNMTYDITEFAYQRFSGNMDYTTKEHYNWP